MKFRNMKKNKKINMKQVYLLIVASLLFISQTMANNLVISGTPSYSSANQTLTFTMAWDNSWCINAGPTNWDAVWLGDLVDENGKKRMVSGDAYIGFVKFPKDGSLPIIETVNTFGASSNPDSPHFADQRALYQAQKTKTMTLDKAQVLKTAEKIYHPK